MPVSIDGAPEVLGVTPETMFGWKTDGLFEFGHGSWRAKDLYDLWLIDRHVALAEDALVVAVGAAFEHQGMALSVADRFLFDEAWGASRGSRRRWESFGRRSGIAGSSEGLPELPPDHRARPGAAASDLRRARPRRPARAHDRVTQTRSTLRFEMTRKRQRSRTATSARPTSSPHHKTRRALTELEAEDEREREADEPVRADVGHEGEAYVACAAERAGRDALDAVEELERRRDGEERHSELRDRRVVGEERDERPWPREEERARARHEARAERDPDEAGAARRTPLADGVADAHRRCPADAEHAHEREAREADGDVVSADGDLAEPACEHRDEREHADLREELEPDGRPEAEHLCDRYVRGDGHGACAGASAG